ncbi:hypothetical protein ABTD94_21430, partial [Acinetobacter baumannii]
RLQSFRCAANTFCRLSGRNYLVFSNKAIKNDPLAASSSKYIQGLENLSTIIELRHHESLPSNASQ